MQILTDTSFIYALYNSKDSRHQRAINFAANYTGGTVIPDVTLPEVSFLFERDLGYKGRQRFYQKFSQANFPLEPITNDDLKRVSEIFDTYEKAAFDFVDCCVMALSERLNIQQIATFDRRDFTIFRPKHCAYLELLP